MRANKLNAYSTIVRGSSPGGFYQARVANIIHEEPNNHKKCFRGPCSNYRNGNKLYCSADCAKLDKLGV